MAQDFLAKKRDMAIKCVEYAAKALALTSQVAELRQVYADMGFNTGVITGLAASPGVNPFIQTDLDATDNAHHLTPALLDTFITDIGNVNLNAAQKTTMRKVENIPVPGPV